MKLSVFAAGLAALFCVAVTVDANHQTLDRGVVSFEVPPRPAARPGAQAAPYQTHCQKGG